MPWKIEERDEKHCVVKESDGSVEKCHDSRSEAEDHMKALYANTEDEGYSKEEIASIPEETIEAAEKSLMKSVGDYLKSWFTKKVEENVPAFQLTKEANGRYSWVARYSNNLLDSDNPPDIISSDSHRKFAALVKEGVVPPPELWIWHVPEWKWGTGTWAVYDESGFALAGGLVDSGKEFIAEAFSKAKAMLVSHQAPLWSVTRSEDDPKIVLEHITKEVSPLPDWAAANKWTGFLISTESGEFISKENDMLDPTQKAELLDKHGISKDLLDKLEKLNESEAAAARASGVQSKELTDATPPAETPVTQATEPVKEESPVSKEAENALMVQVITAVTDLAGVVKELKQKVEALEVQETDKTNKAVEKAASTPVASLAQMMISSVIGAKETQVDGRSSLAKSGPSEAKQQVPQYTPFPLINSFIAGSQKPETTGD